MKKITNFILLFMLAITGVNINLLQAQTPYNDEYGEFANSDSRVVTTIKEIEGSDKVEIEAILVGRLNVGTFQVTLKYDPAFVRPTLNDGTTEIASPVFATGDALKGFLQLNEKLPNRDPGWWDLATAQVNTGEAWVDIIVGGNDYLETDTLIPTGEIMWIFKMYFKKLQPLTNATFTYYEKYDFPPVRNLFTRNVAFLYMKASSSEEIDGINTYANVDVFSRRIPSTVKTNAPEVHGVTATLKGVANSKGLTKVGSGVDGGKGGLDWDIIDTTGFIYSQNNVNLTIDEYSRKLTIGTTDYDFPTFSERVAGTFTRDTNTFFITSKANTPYAVTVDMTADLTGLERCKPYYAYAYMIYNFQTSNNYPVIGTKVEFTPGCNPPEIAATDTAICENADAMLYVTNKADYVGATYQWYKVGIGAITGATESFYKVKYEDVATPGKYYVTVSTSCSCTVASDTLTIKQSTDVFTLPQPEIEHTNKGEICKDANVLLTIKNVDVYEDENATYQWFFNGYPIPGAENIDLLVDSAGIYHVEVMLGDCSMVSEPDTVTKKADIFEYPQPVIGATNGGDICSGANAMLNIENKDEYNGTGAKYQWYYNGAPMPNDTNSYLVTENAGMYRVEVIIGGCSMVADEFEVKVKTDTHECDTKPTIDALNGSVICGTKPVTLVVENKAAFTSPTCSFQWYFNGDSITGATKDTCIATAAGDYLVEVTDGDCSIVSVPFTVTYKASCGKTIRGTVFPFVAQPINELSALFTITASLKPVPKPKNPFDFSATDLFNATPLYPPDTVIRYDGTIFSEGTPKNPGLLGRLDNFGLPINFEDAIGKPRGISMSDTLKTLGQVPDVTTERMTVGLYQFENVDTGKYILELKREGFVTRWALIEVKETDGPIKFLGHRELIPGDIETPLDFTVTVADRYGLSAQFDNAYDWDAPSDYLPFTRYDITGDGSISVSDMYLLYPFIGFAYYHYVETAEWLDELGIIY